MLELNSAVGTIGDEKKEEHLKNLIAQLSQYPEALRDYRERLKEKGINTEGFRPMGSAEGTMSVFAKRVKQGRSWSEDGLHPRRLRTGNQMIQNRRNTLWKN